MSSLTELDQTVGKIAGAIYTEINLQFRAPPLMLVPPITFKVKKVLQQISDPSCLSSEQKKAVAKEIQVSIIPILFSFDIDPVVIEQITPTIEWAALKALTIHTEKKESL